MSNTTKENSGVTACEAYSNDPGTDKAFANCKTDMGNRLKRLVCIDVLNEGVYVEEISGMILFRLTILSVIDCALTAGNSKMPLLLDVVNGCSISDLHNEMTQAAQRLYANGEGDRVAAERFEIIEQVLNSRVLFEQLQCGLSSTGNHYYEQASIAI